MAKKPSLILVAVIISFLFGCHTSQLQPQEIRPINVGDLFPDKSLLTPPSAEDRAYLGLSKGKVFTLKDIKADVVLVEIINVYCPSCQGQVPIYNKLYDLIENDPRTKGHIKMLGIAIGNRDWEIEDFRDRYHVPFPIVPDPDFEVLRAVGGS